MTDGHTFSGAPIVPIDLWLSNSREIKALRLRDNGVREKTQKPLINPFGGGVGGGEGLPLYTVHTDGEDSACPGSLNYEGIMVIASGESQIVNEYVKMVCKV
jgi:hypothetical protein